MWSLRTPVSSCLAKSKKRDDGRQGKEKRGRRRGRGTNEQRETKVVLCESFAVFRRIVTAILVFFFGGNFIKL